MLSDRKSGVDTCEQIYKELRNNDKPAWTGDGYDRAWLKLTEALDSLAATGQLPVPGSHMLELGCGNEMMSSFGYKKPVVLSIT